MAEGIKEQNETEIKTSQKLVVVETNCVSLKVIWKRVKIKLHDTILQAHL